MKSHRMYKIILFLSVVVFVSTFFLPESFGDTRAIIAFFAFAFFVVTLIVKAVSSIVSKRKAIRESKSPVVTPAPVQPVSTVQAKPAEKRKISIERVHVRGVSNYVTNLKSVATENPDYSLTKRELQEDFSDERVWQYQFFVKASLVPEPNNEHDPNAIMVQADGLCIGYVPAGSTSHVRKLMESGRIKHMDLNIGGGKYKEVVEVDDGKYEIERGENNYSAVLELHLTEDNDDDSH